MLKRISWGLLILSFGVLANEDVLTLDRLVVSDFELAFPNEANIQPEPSDFKVNNIALMSSEPGERWAVVTLTNLAQGRRTLSHKQLIALVANGQRITPLELTQSFKAEETLSITINFGESKFPLLTVYTRHN